jgi:hypothetical protein
MYGKLVAAFDGPYPEADGMVDATAERAYRRGYLQGYYAALSAWHNGKTWRQLDKWLWSVLYCWRFSAVDFQGERAVPTLAPNGVTLA